jgi:heat shock protein HslJ
LGVVELTVREEWAACDPPSPQPSADEQPAEEMAPLCSVAASNGTRMRRHPVLRSLPVPVAGAVSAAVLAVTAGTAVATNSQVSAASPLTGKIWVLSSLGGKPPLEDTELTSEFTAKRRVSGSAGCNRYAGTYKVAGNSIRTSPLATTQKACADSIERQETAFLKALSGARSFAVGGATLTLRSAGGRRLATFQAQTQALAGTSWDVLAYNNGKQAVVSVLAETTLTAAFGKSGSLTGFAGCNDYNATYKAAAPKITITQVASTRKHCEEPAGVSDQETSYLAALETAATYRVEGSRLELRTVDGTLAVELHRQ